MKTVCVLIVSCPSIDHVTPHHTRAHLPATPLIIMDIGQSRMFYK